MGSISHLSKAQQKAELRHYIQEAVDDYASTDTSTSFPESLSKATNFENNGNNKFRKRRLEHDLQQEEGEEEEEEKGLRPSTQKEASASSTSIGTRTDSSLFTSASHTEYQQSEQVMPPFDVSKNARQVLSRSTKFDQAETRNDVPVMYRSLSKKHMAYKTFREVLIDVGLISDKIRLWISHSTKSGFSRATKEYFIFEEFCLIKELNVTRIPDLSSKPPSGQWRWSIPLRHGRRLANAISYADRVNKVFLDQVCPEKHNYDPPIIYEESMVMDAETLRLVKPKECENSHAAAG